VVTYTVVVDVDNTDGKLLPYMTAKLQFEVARRTHVVLVPNQALRWRPTWEQISPAARAGLSPPAAAKPRGEDEKESTTEDAEGKVESASPAVWLLADDGLVRPLTVKVGLSDGIVTEIIGGELEPDMPVVIHGVRQAKQDFVSSFVTKVTKK